MWLHLSVLAWPLPALLMAERLQLSGPLLADTTVATRQSLPKGGSIAEQLCICLAAPLLHAVRQTSRTLTAIRAAVSRANGRKRRNNFVYISITAACDVGVSLLECSGRYKCDQLTAIASKLAL